MKSGEYDVHVATEGLSGVDELTAKLGERGFKDDRLTHRNVTYLEGVPTSSCPLIGIHMTKKDYNDITEVREEIKALYDVVKASGLQGYAHAEFTRDEDDVTIRSDDRFKVVRPWPVQRLDAKLRPENKKWDLHINIPIERSPEEFHRVLQGAGFHFIEYIEEFKDGSEEKFRSYTIQGVNRVSEGRQLAEEVLEWLRDCHPPYVQTQFEVTLLGMWRIGDPLIVPPTVDQIQYFG